MADILNLNDKRLSRLPPDRFVREIMRLPAKRRMEHILERQDAEAVTAALDTNDFFLTVQEVGPDDSLALLALATSDQVNHIFDIEWWKKDTIEPARALTWLERLGRASGPKLLEWLQLADFELLIALFKKWIILESAPEEIDMIEARESLPPNTLDDHFFWECRYPQYEELIKQLLTLVYEVNYGFFRELMNHVLLMPETEIEELAYGFHRARLSENAVPDYYEALEIYKAPGPDEFGRKPLISATLKAGHGEEKSQEHLPPSFALAFVPEKHLLGRTLAEVESAELLETLQVELASLANKVIIADQLPTDSADALCRAVEKAVSYVNLGLELISGGDPQKAEEIVENTYLEHLFRLAHSKVARIAGRLRTVVKSGWISRCPAGTKCLDGEWFEAAGEILAKTPGIMRKGDESAGEPPRPDFFRTRADIVHARHIVEVITAAGHLYDTLGADPKVIEPRLWAEGQVRTVDDITLGVLVLTGAARFLATGRWNAEPLPSSNWGSMFPLLRPDAIESAVEDWTRRAAPDEAAAALALEYLVPLLRDYRSEMSAFTPENPPEAELVRFFMFL